MELKGRVQAQQIALPSEGKVDYIPVSNSHVMSVFGPYCSFPQNPHLGAPKADIPQLTCCLDPI